MPIKAVFIRAVVSKAVVSTTMLIKANTLI